MVLHSVKQNLGLLVLFLFVFLAIRVQVAADDCEGARPIEVSLSGISDADASRIQIFAQSPLAKARPLTHLPGTDVWRQHFTFWTHALRLYLPPELLQKSHPLTITIGGEQRFSASTATIQTSWKAVPKPTESSSELVAFDSPPEISAPQSPLFRGVINGPELTPFLEILGQTLGLLVLGIIAVLLGHRALPPRNRALRLVSACLRERAPLPQPKSTERGYAFAGLGVLLLALVALVHGQRYGFVHDDNITQFFPVILQGCESLLQHGVFPTYNPYQLMGAPTTTIGTYALTYPPTYMAYAVANYIFRDRYLTLDIFVLLHLVLGYLATFTLARRIGIRSSLAMMAALSFVLCGYFCVYTRGWFYMAPVALWTPLLLRQLHRLTDPKPLCWRWAASTGIVIGLYFHAGNAQMWSYTLLLSVALVLLWKRAGRLTRGRLLWALAGLLIGLALAAPLLITQAAEVVGIDREANVKTGTLRGFVALLLPSPLVRAAHPGIEPGAPNVWNHLFNFAPLYFCSPVFLGAGLLALASLFTFRWDRRCVGANAWLLCGGLALVLSLGENGGLAQLFAQLPGFNKFQHWWKLLPFVALFFALGGALLVERWLQITRRARLTEQWMTGIVPILLVYNAFISQPMMTIPDKPYPPLPSAVRALVLNPQEPQQRSMALAPWLPEWKEPGFVGSLSQNIATIYGVPMLEGYDPLVEKTPLNVRLKDRLYRSTTFKRVRQDFDPIPIVAPLEALHRYGVRWIILTEGHEELKGTYALDQVITTHTSLRLRLPHTSVFELSGSDPLAFVEDIPEHPLPIAFDATGAKVELGKFSEGGTVVVNLLARERLHAFVDGKPTPITKDAWDRVTVKTQTGAKRLTLRYEPNWGKGFFLSGCLLLSAAGVLLSCRKMHTA